MEDFVLSSGSSEMPKSVHELQCYSLSFFLTFTNTYCSLH